MLQLQPKEQTRIVILTSACTGKRDAKLLREIALRAISPAIDLPSCRSRTLSDILTHYCRNSITATSSTEPTKGAVA
jgi:uncharacterized membrane protein